MWMTTLDCFWSSAVTRKRMMDGDVHKMDGNHVDLKRCNITKYTRWGKKTADPEIKSCLEKDKWHLMTSPQHALNM